MMSGLVRLYRHPGLTQSQHEAACNKINLAVGEDVLVSLDTELCYYIDVDAKTGLSDEEQKIIKWVLSVPFESDKLTAQSVLEQISGKLLFEIGPRLNFSTAQSSNSISIFHSFGFTNIRRVEVSTRYLLTFKKGSYPSPQEEAEIVNSLHDKMTQCCYPTPLETFSLSVNPEPVFEVDILGEGRSALDKANKVLGLAFDQWDLDYYTKLFREKVQRNPTSVECFDIAQSNSEHSRHWFFKGRLVVDGKEHPDSLFSMIMDTQTATNDNNVIKFSDNSRNRTAVNIPNTFSSIA